MKTCKTCKHSTPVKGRKGAVRCAPRSLILSTASKCVDWASEAPPTLPKKKPVPKPAPKPKAVKTPKKAK